MMNHIRTVVFISLIILLGGLKETPTHIIFYGDSLTAGYGLDPDQAFPALVEKKLIESGKDVKVINAGLSGETSAGGASRISWVLKQPVDIFILELGANDGLRGLQLDQTRKNLQSIVDKVKEKYPEVKIIIAGMEAPPNLGDSYTTEFRSMFPNLAKQNNAALIPFLLEDVAGHKDLNLPDGIHPNPDGHKIVANTVLSVLLNMI